MLITVPTNRLPAIQSSKADGTPAHGTTEGLRMLEMFRGVVPIPIELPGAQYIDGDKPELRPWFSQEN